MNSSAMCISFMANSVNRNMGSLMEVSRYPKFNLFTNTQRGIGQHPHMSVSSWVSDLEDVYALLYFFFLLIHLYGFDFHNVKAIWWLNTVLVGRKSENLANYRVYTTFPRKLSQTLSCQTSAGKTVEKLLLKHCAYCSRDRLITMVSVVIYALFF